MARIKIRVTEEQRDNRLVRRKYIYIYIYGKMDGLKFLTFSKDSEFNLFTFLRSSMV